MKLAFQHSYPAPPADVASLLRNEAFLDDVARHAGAVSHQTTIGTEETRVQMALPAPSNIQKFVGNTVTVVISLAFNPSASDGSMPGTVSVDVPGMPITATASSKLTPTQTGSAGHYEGELKVRIPLVGGKVEAQIEPFVVDAFAGIESRANVWLRR